MVILSRGLLPTERDNDGVLIEAIGDLVCQKDFTLVRRCEGLILDVSNGQAAGHYSDSPASRLATMPTTIGAVVFM